MEYTTVELIIAFISVAILSVMIDKFTLFLEGVISRIPGFPDKFEWWFAYALIVGIGFLVCSEGHFSLFAYLQFEFNYDWEGYLLTSLIISGGSTFVRSQFGLISEIPSSIGGVTTTFRRLFTRGTGTKSEAGTSGSSGGGSYTSTTTKTDYQHIEIEREVVEGLEGEVSDDTVAQAPKKPDYSDKDRYDDNI